MLSRGLGGTGIFSKSGRELNTLVLPASNLKANGSGAEATSLNTLQKSHFVRQSTHQVLRTKDKCNPPEAPQSAQSSGTTGGAAASVLRSINPRAANDRGPGREPEGGEIHPSRPPAGYRSRHHVDHGF